MFQLYVALKYLKSHRIIYFSICSITIGMMVLIVVISVMNGFSRDIRLRIKGINSSFQIYGNGIYIKDYKSLIQRITKNVSEVTGAAPRIENIAWLGRTGAGRKTVRIMGIDPAYEKAASQLEFYFREGNRRNFDFTHNLPAKLPPVVVCSELDSYTSQRVGLTTVREDIIPRIYNRDFVVIGSFKTGMYEYDSAYVLMNLDDAQRFLNLRCSCSNAEDCSVTPEVCSCIECECQEPVVNYIAVEVVDYEANKESIRTKIVDVLHGWKYNSSKCGGELHSQGICGYYRVATWEELRWNLLQAVSIERNIQTVIIFFIIIVAGFNIVAIFTLLVRSKTKDIGIMRALGVTRGQTASIFIICGVLAGLAGALTGVIAGLKISYSLNDIADSIEHSGKVIVDTIRGAQDSFLVQYSAPLSALLAAIAFISLLKGRKLLNAPLKLFFIFASSCVMSVCLPAAYMPAPAALIAVVIALFVWYAASGHAHGHKLLALFYALSAAAMLSILDPMLFWESLLTDYLFRVLIFGLGLYLAAKFITATELTKVAGWLFFAILCFALVSLNLIIANLPPPSWQGPQLFPKDVYYLDRIPAMVDYSAIVSIVISAMIVSFLSTLYPAFKASDLEPVEAIRNE